MDTNSSHPHCTATPQQRSKHTLNSVHHWHRTDLTFLSSMVYSLDVLSTSTSGMDDSCFTSDSKMLAIRTGTQLRECTEYREPLLITTHTKYSYVFNTHNTRNTHHHTYICPHPHTFTHTTHHHHVLSPPHRNTSCRSRVALCLVSA